MITKEQLIDAKNELLNLKETSKGRVFLKGDNKVLLTANVININKNKKPSWVSHLAHDENTFATIAYLLHKVSGCHTAINFMNLQLWGKFENFIANETKGKIRAFIEDENIRKYILDNDIQALINHVIWYESYHRDLEIFEYNSSYNFGGFTGFSNALDALAQKHNLTTQLGSCLNPTIDEFYKYGYRFNDEIIKHYSEFAILGLINNPTLSKEQIWPRTMEILAPATIKNNEEKLINLANAEAEFIEKITQEVKENGINNALEPQYVKKM